MKLHLFTGKCCCVTYINFFLSDFAAVDPTTHFTCTAGDVGVKFSPEGALSFLSYNNVIIYYHDIYVDIFVSCILYMYYVIRKPNIFFFSLFKVFFFTM